MAGSLRYEVERHLRAGAFKALVRRALEVEEEAGEEERPILLHAARKAQSPFGSLSRFRLALQSPSLQRDNRTGSPTSSCLLKNRRPSSLRPCQMVRCDRYSSSRVD